MKPTNATFNEMTVSVRTEAGRVSVDMGLDHLSGEQRGFIFAILAKTHKGGSVSFSLLPGEDGEHILHIHLRGPLKKSKVVKAVREELH